MSVLAREGVAHRSLDAGKARSPSAAAGEGRIEAVDLLRGFAILTMVAANFAGEILERPHPFWFRLSGSFAAPLFITLAGEMVAHAVWKRQRDLAGTASGGRRSVFPYFLKRGGMLILTAMMIDLFIWRRMPLVAFDVLYVIGLALPLACLLSLARPSIQFLFPMAIFAATPLMQQWLGYRLEIEQPPLDDSPEVLASVLATAWRRFLVDGWFPAFPWLGFALFGVVLESLRRSSARSGRTFLVIGLPALAAGIALWSANPGPLAPRMGYSELFYPATPGFLLTAVGLIMILFPLANLLAGRGFINPLMVLGRCALFLYIAHILLIHTVLKPMAGPVSLERFGVLYLLLMASLWAIALGLDRLKKQWREEGYHLPPAVTFLLGG
jgi:uncharacterized membrane protein